MKKLALLFILGLSFLVLSQMSYAYDFLPSSAAQLIITKSSLSPVPAEPGKDLLLEIIIDNYGQSDAKNLTVEIKPDSSILLKNENERIIYKESICAFCRMTNTYHLHVDPRAVSGTYEVKIEATRGEAGSTFGIVQTFNVTVRGNPQLGLSNVIIRPSVVTPGENFTLGFFVANNGTGMANAIGLKAILDGTPFIPAGTNSLILGKLDAGSAKNVQYTLIVKSGATPGEYSLPVQLVYENENGENISAKELVGIKVLSKAKLSVANVKTDPSKLISGNEMTLTIRVENSGTGDAKSVRAAVDLPFQGTKTAFLGKIGPDEDAPAVFNLQTDVAGSYKYKLTTAYEDDLGEHEQQQDLDVTVYGGGVSTTTIVIIALAAIALGYFGYTRLAKR